MAFAATITAQTVFGNFKVNMGTYTQGNGDTGGAVTTGLASVKFFQATGATKQATSGGAVTITTADPGDDATGYWLAIGH